MKFWIKPAIENRMVLNSNISIDLKVTFLLFSEYISGQGRKCKPLSTIKSEEVQHQIAKTLRRL